MSDSVNNIPKPLIHLNGNSREALLAQYSKAYEDAKALRESLLSIEFHERDYYPLGAEAYSRAREARTQVLRNIEATHDYLRDHVYHLHMEGWPKI